jgi:DNA gyrase subunit A
MMSNNGQTLRTSMQNVRVQGRSTQGVCLVNLRETDILVAIQKISSLEGAKEESPMQQAVETTEEPSSCKES